MARRDAERVYVGKAPGCHSWPQDKINDILVNAALQGKRVVRLKCGDPGIFARAAEELSALQTAGVPYEIVPGVTAASAAAASTGAMLTDRETTQTLVLTTGQTAEQNGTPDWIGHLRAGANVAIYMGVQNAADIANAVEEAGLGGKVHAHIVSHAQMPGEKTVTCKPAELPDVIGQHAIANPAIIFLRYPRQLQIAESQDGPTKLRAI